MAALCCVDLTPDLGLSDVHVVGHSLGGKVAAVAALQLAEQARKDELREQSVGGGEEDANDESAVELSHSKPKLKLKLLSLTLIDVSPVDYEADDAFADVLRTLDIVEDLNGQLLHLGQVQDNGDRSDSHSSAGRDVTVANVRVQLNSLLGEKVADPMLKAFLMASIQPKEEKTLGPGFRDVSSPVRALMQRIGTSRDRLAQQQSGGLGSDAQQSSNQKEEDKEEEENVHGSSTCAVSEGSSLTSTLPNKEADTAAGNLIAASIPVSVPTSGGFEWKFSVDGIAGFRNKLCGWPSLYATQDRGDASPLTPYLEPVLLMKGANSKFVRSSHIPSISAMFPMFTLVTVRDAGHWLHFEKPNESSESLIRFILRVEERGRADS